MSWREDLGRVTFPDGRRMVGASFRGVPFYVEASDRTGGRRVVMHEFPGADDPFGEDMGRAGRTFHVDGYVIGDDYLDHRNALLEALEDEEGPGQLIHPYHRTRSVICTGVSVREDKRSGGIAVFSIDFAETPAQPPAPTAVDDLAGTVDLSADLADAAILAEFAAGYDVDGLPSFAFESIGDALVGMSGALGDALGPIVEVTQDAARLDQELRILQADAAALIRTPGDVLGAFRDTFATLADTILGVPGAMMDALLDAFDFDFGVGPSELTATRRREKASRDALAAGMRRLLVTQAARLAVRATFETHDQAVAAATAIAAKLELEAETAGDEVYPALSKLRTDVLRAVPGEAVLAKLTTTTRNVPIPALLIAYQLYGSTELADDIISRNRIRHPGFVAGTLAVLADD